MKYHTATTQFNCGIDLHAHQMHVCLLDRQDRKLEPRRDATAIFQFEWIARGFTVVYFWTVPGRLIRRLESRLRCLLHSGRLD